MNIVFIVEYILMLKQNQEMCHLINNPLQKL